MDDQVQQLAERLRWEVTDEAAGQGRYVWVPDPRPVDPQVVGYLVNYYRTAGAAFTELMTQASATALELEAARAEVAKLRQRLSARTP